MENDIKTILLACVATCGITVCLAVGFTAQYTRERVRMALDCVTVLRNAAIVPASTDCEEWVLGKEI